MFPIVRHDRHREYPFHGEPCHAFTHYASVENVVHHASVLPSIAGDDLANALASGTVKSPFDATLAIAGPEHFRLDEFIRGGLRGHDDRREVVADPHSQ